MDIEQFLNIFNSPEIFNVFFKAVTIFLSAFYVLYSVIIAKQVRIMNKTLEHSFNQVIFAVCSVQTTVALILLIFTIFL